MKKEEERGRRRARNCERVRPVGRRTARCGRMGKVKGRCDALSAGREIETDRGEEGDRKSIFAPLASDCLNRRAARIRAFASRFSFWKRACKRQRARVAAKNEEGEREGGGNRETTYLILLSTLSSPPGRFVFSGEKCAFPLERAPSRERLLIRMYTCATCRMSCKKTRGSVPHRSRWTLDMSESGEK